MYGMTGGECRQGGGNGERMGERREGVGREEKKRIQGIVDC